MVTIKNRAAKYAFILPALLLFLAGCTPAGPRALLAGKKLLDAGKSQEAAEKLKLATALMPTNALAFNYLGLACQESGQMAEAERAYVRALTLNHELAEVRFNLGCLYLAQNKLEQAKSELTAFTLRKGSFPEGFLKLGTVQLRSRETSAAERSFNEALRLEPKNPEALTGLGLAKLQRSRATEAVQFFTKALQAHPQYRPALVNLAVVTQEQLKDRPAAIRYYRQLLALKPPPENASAILAIINTLEQEQVERDVLRSMSSNALVRAQGQRQTELPKQAPASNFAQALPPPKNELLPSAPPKAPVPTNATTPADAREVAAKLSANNESQRKTVGNTAPFRQILNTAAPPVTPLEMVTLATEPVLKAGQDPLPASTAAVKKQPTAASPGPATNLATTATAKRGLFQKINPARLFGEEKPATAKAPETAPMPAERVTPASAPAETAAQNEPAFVRYSYKNPPKPAPGNHSEAERSYAQALQAHNSQHLPEAMQAYRRAIQLDPAFFNAHYNLALAAAASGNLPLALSTYETALALRPDFLDARYNFALVLKQANYPLDAANELEKLLGSYPTDVKSHLALGNLYAQQLGKPALARRHYQKVLEIDPRNSQAATIHYWLTQHPK